MDLYRFVIPLGLISYGLMCIAVLTGLRVIKVKTRIHKIVALLGIIGATIHAVIIIYYNFF